MTFAEFLAQIEDMPEPLCVLVEQTFAFYNSTTLEPDQGTVYLSNMPYATGPSETPASTSYIDAIVGLPVFTRAVDPLALGGHAALSVGDLELDNGDGRLDFMLQILINGQTCRVLIGLESWPRQQFFDALVCVADVVNAPSTNRIVVRLRDPGLLLNKRIAGSVIGGSTVNAERRKPIALGAPRQVEPVLSDATELRYWLGSSVAPADVRDSGVSLRTGYPSAVGVDGVIAFDAASDVITISGHGFQNGQVVTCTSSGTMPGGVTSGQQYWVRNRTATTFQLSATRSGAILNITSSSFTGTMTIIAKGYYVNGDGSIDLSATPVGRVTADIATATASDRRLPQVIEQLVLTHAGLPPSMWGGAHSSLSTIILNNNDPMVGYYVTEPENCFEILNALMEAGPWFWGFTRLGQLFFGRIASDGAGAPSANLTIQQQDLDGPDAFSYEHLSPRYDVLSVLHQRNWTVQSDGLATSVSAENRQRWGSSGIVRRHPSFPFSNTPGGNPRLYNLAMSDSPQVDSMIAGSTDAESEDFADLLLDELRDRAVAHHEIVRARVGLRFMDVEIGSAMNVAGDVPGIGGSGGMRVIGVTIDLEAANVHLTMHRLRDTSGNTTGAYYG